MDTNHIKRRVIDGEEHRCAGFMQICHLGIGDRHEWYTTAPVVYYSAKFDYTVTVPEWFINDLASIPKIVHSFISDDGYERAAAIVHDWLCVTAEVPRWVADAIFKEACYVAGTKRRKIAVMYPAVRAYSLTAGRKDTYNRAEAHPDQHFINPNKRPRVNRRTVQLAMPPLIW